MDNVTSHSTGVDIDPNTWSFPNAMLHPEAIPQGRSLASGSDQAETIQPLGPASRHVCQQCGKHFKSQNDADRHHRTIHEKLTPYICQEPGCRRAGRGFSRKDNYEKHLRQVHWKHLKSRNTNSASRRERRESTVTDVGLEGYSRQELVEMLVAEREKCRDLERENEKARDELMKLRSRLEQREDMWLQVLVSKKTKQT